jgi:hypothetical protein
MATLGAVAEGERRRRWPHRASAVLAWLWALWLMYLGLPYHLRYLALGLAVLLGWIGLGAWKGAPRRTIALGGIGVLGAAWFVRGMLVEVRNPLDGSTVQRPAGLIAFIGLEAGLALTLGALALVSRRPVHRRVGGATPAAHV